LQLAPYYGTSIVAQTIYTTASIDDLYLVAPTGAPTGATVAYSLNLSVGGSIGGSGFGSDWSAAAAFIGETVGGDGCAAEVSGNITDVGGSGTTGSGIFAGGSSWSGSTPSVCSGSNGEAITANLELNTNAVAQLDGTESGDPSSATVAYVNYADPAMFSDTGPLFNFSEPGWTVDSTDGCVVNNRYLCAPSLAIPEPVSWVLMLTGFSGLGYAGYRKAKTNSVLSAV
jgi:hypothetical protein